MKCKHKWNDWQGDINNAFRWYGKCEKCGEWRCTVLEDGFPSDEIWETW